MTNRNTILIKRRTSGLGGAPSSLSGGELAFNEVDSTLYYGYGSNGDVVSIAGAGAYVDRTTAQTISGDKTFNGFTILSSTTFLPDSTINFGGNILTNLETPLISTDAATKKYVDDGLASISNSGSTLITNLSTEVYDNFVKLIEDRPVIFNSTLTVTENLSGAPNTSYLVNFIIDSGSF